MFATEDKDNSKFVKSVFSNDLINTSEVFIKSSYTLLIDILDNSLNIKLNDNGGKSKHLRYTETKTINGIKIKHTLNNILIIDLITFSPPIIIS